MRKGDQFTLQASPVFPDPLTERNGFQAMLAFELHDAGEFQLYIYDGGGRRVMETRDVGRKGMNTARIDAATLAPGGYTFILSNGTEYARGRFVVAK